jgi:hypothetical protein
MSDELAPPGLTPDKRARLAELEERIVSGVRAAADVGMAFEAIREERLYLEYDPPEFKRYCAERWDMSEGQVYRLIDCAKVLRALESPNGRLDLKTLPPPPSERVIRELAPVLRRAEATPEADVGATVTAAWEAVLERHPDGTPSARETREALMAASFVEDTRDQPRPANIAIRLGKVGDALADAMHKLEFVELALDGERLPARPSESAMRYAEQARDLATRLEAIRHE